MMIPVNKVRITRGRLDIEPFSGKYLIITMDQAKVQGSKDAKIPS